MSGPAEGGQQFGTGLISGQFAVRLAAENCQFGRGQVHSGHAVPGNNASECLISGGANAGGQGVLLASSSALFYLLRKDWLVLEHLGETLRYEDGERRWPARLRAESSGLAEVRGASAGQ